MMLSICLAMLTIAGWGWWVYQRVGAPVPERACGDVLITPSVAAWLAGGARRVADTWWTQMTQSALLVRDTDHRHYTPVPNARHEHLDAWAQKAYAQLSRSRTPHQVLQAWSGPLKQLAKHLERNGYIHPVEDYRRRQREVAVFLLSSGVACSLAVLVGGWGAWAFLPFLEVVFISILVYFNMPPRLTRHGSRELERLREENMHATLAPQLDTLPMAVAMAGPAVLLGTPYASYASPATKKSDSSSGCSGGCAAAVASWGSDGSGGPDGGGCGSSGCGSSGCGGGGCGGCGG